jgi:acetolactate synthase-1/2/3 large subunit
VVAACNELAPEGTVATVDAGSHMFAATLFWRARGPRSFLISNGLATMGYALPAAIGAALCKEAPVVCFTGDGGLAMCAGELATAARLGVPVIVVVFNDGALNLIKTKQEKRGSTTLGLDFEAVDWATAARGFGLESTAASTRDEVAAAFGAALAARTPWLIDARVDAATYADLLTLVRG